jgi:hypothetical protein
VDGRPAPAKTMIECRWVNHSDTWYQCRMDDTRDQQDWSAFPERPPETGPTEIHPLRPFGLSQYPATRAGWLRWGCNVRSAAPMPPTTAEIVRQITGEARAVLARLAALHAPS